MKACPYCGEEVSDAAAICKHCMEWLPQLGDPGEPPDFTPEMGSPTARSVAEQAVKREAIQQNTLAHASTPSPNEVPVVGERDEELDRPRAKSQRRSRSASDSSHAAARSKRGQTDPARAKRSSLSKRSSSETNIERRELPSCADVHIEQVGEAQVKTKRDHQYHNSYVITSISVTWAAKTWDLAFQGNAPPRTLAQLRKVERIETPLPCMLSRVEDLTSTESYKRQARRFEMQQQARIERRHGAAAIRTEKKARINARIRELEAEKWSKRTSLGRTFLEKEKERIGQQIARLEKQLETAQYQLRLIDLSGRSESASSRAGSLPPEKSRTHSREAWYYKGSIFLIDGPLGGSEQAAGLLENYLSERKNGARKRAPIPADVRMFVWRRDQGRCSECGSKENLEYDHVVAVVRGGSNTARNIRLLCEKCNRSKGARV
jgi:hypothetical protein